VVTATRSGEHGRGGDRSLALYRALSSIDSAGGGMVLNHRPARS
jgi:hypothetical protein